MLLLESRQQRVGCEEIDARRAQLDGEGQTVQLLANLRQDGEILRRYLKFTCQGLGALGKESNRRLHVQGWDMVAIFGAQVQAFTACHEDAQPWTGGEEFCQQGRRGDDLFIVVEK